MSAYMIVDITIKDADLYAQYVEAVRPLVEAFGGHYLVRGGQAIALAGDDPQAGDAGQCSRWGRSRPAPGSPVNAVTSGRLPASATALPTASAKEPPTSPATGTA